MSRPLNVLDGNSRIFKAHSLSQLIHPLSPSWFLSLVPSEMIPLSKPTSAQHWNPSEVESQTGSQISLPTQKTQPAQEIPVWRRWLVVFGAFLALFCTFGQLSSFGTYLSWHRRNQLSSHSPAAISWIGSLQLWVFFLSVRPLVVHKTTNDSNVLSKGGAVGLCFDRYGPGPILITGTVVYVSSLMATSYCQSYIQYLLVQGVMFGLGVGLM